MSPAGLGSVSLQAVISSLKSHFCDPCLSSDLNPRCLVLKNSLRVTLNLKDIFLPAPAEHWWRVLSGFEPATSVFLLVSGVSSPHRKGVRASGVFVGQRLGVGAIFSSLLTTSCSSVIQQDKAQSARSKYRNTNRSALEEHLRTRLQDARCPGD